MSPISHPLEDYYAAHEDAFLDGLKEFLRIPSISTLPEHRADVDRAADVLTGDLERMGTTLTDFRFRGPRGSVLSLMRNHRLG